MIIIWYSPGCRIITPVCSWHLIQQVLFDFASLLTRACFMKFGRRSATILPSPARAEDTHRTDKSNANGIWAKNRASFLRTNQNSLSRRIPIGRDWLNTFTASGSRAQVFVFIFFSTSLGSRACTCLFHPFIPRFLPKLREPGFLFVNPLYS